MENETAVPKKIQEKLDAKLNACTTTKELFGEIPNQLMHLIVLDKDALVHPKPYPDEEYKLSKVDWRVRDLGKKLIEIETGVKVPNIYFPICMEKENFLKYAITTCVGINSDTDEAKFINILGDGWCGHYFDEYKEFIKHDDGFVPNELKHIMKIHQRSLPTYHWLNEREPGALQNVEDVINNKISISKDYDRNCSEIAKEVLGESYKDFFKNIKKLSEDGVDVGKPVSKICGEAMKRTYVPKIISELVALDETEKAIGVMNRYDLHNQYSLIQK